ncbi:hypothetical protein OQA88_12435 [Cercophora sp. LCS_1]
MSGDREDISLSSHASIDIAMTLITSTDSLDSKRMYDKRFREWNVFKNVNSDEKDRMMRRAQARPRTSTPLIDRDSMSEEDLRKTLRVAKAIPQGMRRSIPEPPPYHAIAGPSTTYARPPEAARRGLGIEDLIRDRTITTIPTPRLELPPLQMSEGHSPQTLSSPDLGYATPTSTTGSSEERPSTPLIARSPAASPLPNLSTFEAQIRTLAETPPPHISSDPKNHSLDIITRSLKNYYEWQLDNIPEGVLPDDFLGRRSSTESTQYWGTIKNAIYLVKVSAGSSLEELEHRPDRRAWPAFAEAGRTASAAMTTHPFDFLRNVFSTLSPANTSARPELRGILLQFLTSEARDTLSPNHPITMICQELQRDENCQEVSRRGLQCMLDIFSERLGRSRAVSFKLLDSLATMLRRNGEFEPAMEIVLELLNSCRQVFGPTSDQARIVENELAHFYMVADVCDQALVHCMAVVRRPQEPGAMIAADEQAFYQDGIAAHAMEDIAEIHQRRGDIETTIMWLERAASLALSIWGPKAVATGHIVDKMTGLQKRTGKDLLRSALLWETLTQGGTLQKQEKPTEAKHAE